MIPGRILGINSLLFITVTAPGGACVSQFDWRTPTGMDKGKQPRRAAESLANKGKKAGRRIGRAGTKASANVMSGASTAGNQVSNAASTIRRSITGAIPWEDSRTDAARHLLTTSIESSTAIGQRTKQALIDGFESAYNGTTSKATSVRNQAGLITMGVLAPEGVLAPDSPLEIDSWLTSLLKNSTPSIYDKAMDATYNATDVGGNLHRLFDGGHSLLGAIKAGHNASPDDSIIQEAVGTVSAIFRDFVTVRGLPFFTWDKDTFDSVKDTLASDFHISKSWFNELNAITVPELLTTSIGALALILNWNNEDREAFAKTIASTAIISVLGPNPILFVVTLAALAKSFTDARREGNYTEFVEGLAKGGVVTGAVIATASVVGGPVYVGLLAGICTGVVANKVMNTVDGVAMRDFVANYFNLAIEQSPEL